MWESPLSVVPADLSVCTEASRLAVLGCRRGLFDKVSKFILGPRPTRVWRLASAPTATQQWQSHSGCLSQLLFKESTGPIFSFHVIDARVFWRENLIHSELTLQCVFCEGTLVSSYAAMSRWVLWWELASRLSGTADRLCSPGALCL